MLRLPGSKLRSFLPFSALLVIFALILSACGPTGTPSAQTNTESKPVNGGTWIDDLYEEPDSLLPGLSVEDFSYLADQSLWAPLFQTTSTGAIVPGIATELPTVQNGDVNADATTWTFKLRPGLKWSDGQPLNADDVDFTWKLLQNPKFAAPNLSIVKHIQSATVSADKLSITFHLDQPFSPFLTVFTDGINAPLPAHRYASMEPSQIKKSGDNLNPPVTSGPFKMAESKPGDHYTVVRNPDYYLASQGEPYLNQVVFRVVTDSSTILKDLQAGAVDSSSDLDASKIATYKQLSNYTFYTAASAGYEAIHFNEKNPILKDINVRTAISYAIDRNTLIKIARQGAGIALCTDNSSAYHPGYQPDIQCPPFDLTKAGQILDQDGWKTGSDNVRTKNGARLEFQYSTTANNAWRAEDEEILQADFAKIGIKLDITNYPASTFFGTFLSSGKPGQYDMTEWESSENVYADDSVNLSCDEVGKSNFNWYCNQQLDALFKQEQSTADTNQQQQIFDQIHAILLKDVPIVPMYSPDALSIVAKGTHNYAPSPFLSGETDNIMTWWCDNGKCPA